MACTGLNAYTANVAQRFKEVIKKSSIKDPYLLNQLHTINSNREWMKPESYYYPKEQVCGMDDYGDRLKLDLVKRYEIKIGAEAKSLARKVFKQLTQRTKNSPEPNGPMVHFPDFKHPKLMLDSRTGKLSENKTSTKQAHWLVGSTLVPGQRVQLPVLLHPHYQKAAGPA